MIRAVRLVVALAAAVLMASIAAAPASASPVWHDTSYYVEDGYWTDPEPIYWGYYDDANAPNCVDIPNCYDHWYDPPPYWTDTSHWVNQGYYTYSPDNLTPPEISGTARATRTLTATTGDWTNDAANNDPTNTYTYQWQRCDAAGAACASVPGATASTVTLAEGDIGSTFRVAVTATNASGANTASSAATPVVGANVAVNTTPPSITGTARDGQTLHADRGSWTGVDTYSYQWERCVDGSCSDIPSAAGQNYTLTSDDVDAMIRVTVTGANDQNSAAATSSQVGPVEAAAPANTLAPAITGAFVDGATLTVTDGTWTGTVPMTVERQWLRCGDTTEASCTDITGETARAYTLRSADVGHLVRLRETARNQAGERTVLTNLTGGLDGNDPATPIAPVAPSLEAAPQISGELVDTETLSVDSGDWSGTTPMTFAYQWERCDAAGGACDAIAGATATTYTLTPDDIGSTIKVTVAATNMVSTVSGETTASAVVAPDPARNTTLPSITGQPIDGETLTADQGVWTGSPALSYALQWMRCDAAGVGCAPIDGQTTATYTLGGVDIGSTIRLRVTATNPAGDTIADSHTAGSGGGASPPQPVGPAIPVNSAAPAVSGEARDGATVAASPGVWTGTPSISYAFQWQRCDASDCAGIPGATASSYTAGAADVGHGLRVAVTAANAGGQVRTVSAATDSVAGNPPIMQRSIAIRGVTRVGQTLAVDRGAWTGTVPMTQSLQWLACDSDGDACQPITGPDARDTLRLGEQHVGRTIRVQMTVRNAGGSVTVRSHRAGSSSAVVDDGTTVIAAAPGAENSEGAPDGAGDSGSAGANQRPVAQPVVGKVNGRRVRLDGRSSYDTDGMIVTYRWTLGGKTIGSAAAITHRFGKAKRYRVTLTVTDDKGARGSKTITVRPGQPAPRKVRLSFSSDVLFRYGSAALSDRSRAALRRLAPTLRDARSIRISGHTDSRGGRAFNKRLSRRRAIAVRVEIQRMLRGRSVPITVRAYGESRPKVSNRTAGGRAQNRRVELLVRR